MRWHESFRPYDASVQGVPAKPSQAQREALARVRAAALATVAQRGELPRRPCFVRPSDLDVFAVEVMGAAQ